MRKFVRGFILGGLVLVSTQLVAQPRALQVVVSIPPLAAMVMPLLDEEDELIVLLDPGASPHGFQLKPSHIRQLQQADLVITVGTGVDAWLNRALRNYNGAQLVMAETDGVDLLPKREGGVWAAPDRGHQHNHKPQAQPNSPRTDGHIWLGLANAQALITASAQALTELNPLRAGEIQAREQEVIASLVLRNQAWSAQLASLKDQPFVVMHDAYQYFEHSFGLNAAGTIHVNPEVPPSVRRLHELRQMMAEREVACVFKEPQFPVARLQAVVQGTEVNIGSLDPLGFDGVIRPYEAFYDRLVQDFAACFD